MRRFKAEKMRVDAGVGGVEGSSLVDHGTNGVVPDVDFPSDTNEMAFIEICALKLKPVFFHLQNCLLTQEIYSGINAYRKLRNISYPLANWELGHIHLVYLLLCDERRKQG
ncbi:hypothetical protein AgCh_016770 [Apium graveolens]